ncbi:SDR family oxidoreductase [Streptomyces sp. NPDC048392]|uniref:SDR family oxidoreductase n=1 Tax=Streptomyces sp. NPDC048392 TaxID=3365543 RepID=UPI0037188768
MRPSAARVPVAGATGVFGGATTAEPADRGARVALAGRDPSRLSRAARTHPGAVTARCDADGPESGARAVRDTLAAPEGLEGFVAAFGSVAFGAAEEAGDEGAEHLMPVGHLAPAAFCHAAHGILRTGPAIAAVTGVMAEPPQPRMTGHSVSRAAR